MTVRFVSLKERLRIKDKHNGHTIMGEKYKTEEELIWEKYSEN